MRKKIKVHDSKFSKVFVNLSDSNKKRAEFLSEYLSIVDNDRYMENIYNKIVSGIKVSEQDLERVEDLIDNVDLNELLVNSLLDEGGYKSEKFPDSEDSELDKLADKLLPRSVLEERIINIMSRENDLGGWDRKFVFGDDGTALLNQCRNRGGWLSEKQIKQLERIERVLKIG